MKRREFIGAGIVAACGMGAVAWAQGAAPKKDEKKADAAAKTADAGGKKALTEKDILREGQPATIPNYCEKPEAPKNKFCPTWPTNKGHCETCMFYNKDNSETTYKGGKYARCMLLSDPTKPQFVALKAYCSTWAKKT